MAQLRSRSSDGRTLPLLDFEPAQPNSAIGVASIDGSLAGQETYVVSGLIQYEQRKQDNVL